MCELLGMDCNTPTDLVFSFRGFSQRGGATGPHGDGWGLAFFEGRASRLFLDPGACAASPLADFFRRTPVKTLQAVAHIRKKTRGRVRLANTHPFQRELWGRHWVFAHNGTLRGAEALKLGRFDPVGTTDSERAFCSLLEAVRASFRAPPTHPEALWEAIADEAGRIARLGTFNFVMANGEYLFARCDTRLCHIVRRYPFGRATLKDEQVSIDFGAVTTPRDRVAVIATTPLTVDETWTHGDPATLWVFKRGRLLATLPSGVPIARKVPRILRARPSAPVRA
jgi:predicted glutamine amidotransferase